MASPERSSFRPRRSSLRTDLGPAVDIMQASPVYVPHAGPSSMPYSDPAIKSTGSNGKAQAHGPARPTLSHRPITSITESISHRLRLSSPVGSSGSEGRGSTPLHSPDLPSDDLLGGPSVDGFFGYTYDRRGSDQTDTLTTPDLEPQTDPAGALYSFGGPAKGEGDVAFGARVRREFPFPAVDLKGTPAHDDAIRMLGRMHRRGTIGSAPGSPEYDRAGGALAISPLSSPDPSTFHGGSPRLGPTLPVVPPTSFSEPDAGAAGTMMLDPRRSSVVPSGLYGHARPDEARQAAKEGQKRYHEDHRAGVAVKTNGPAEDAGLMGHGSFGTAIRDKVAEVLERMCATVPEAVKARPLVGRCDGSDDGQDREEEDDEEDEEAGEVVSIVEYDASGSRSASLIQPIIEVLEKRRFRIAQVSPASSIETVRLPALSPPSDPTLALDGPTGHRRHSRTSTASSSYVVTHASHPSTDTRTLSVLSESSYLDQAWQARQSPSLVDSVFASYTNRTFGKAAVPRATVSVGFSIMEMQKAFTTRARGMSETQHADLEFRAFLKARALEFRRGGSLVLAFAVGRDARPKPARPALNRSLSEDVDTGTGSALARSNSLPPSPTRHSFEPSQPCLWQQLERIVAFSIRSLVTQGLIKPAVAAAMERLPLHARTAKQMRLLLHAVKDDWKIEWSCGLGRDPERIGPTPPESKSKSGASQLGVPAHSAVETVEGPLKLTHPAQLAFENGAIGPSVWAEHAVALVRACYEFHCRNVLLSDPATRDRAAAEYVLEALWDDLEMRVAGGALKGAQLEVAVVGLRRV